MGPCRSFDTATCSLIIVLVLLPLASVSDEEPVSCDIVTIDNAAVYRTSDSRLNTTMLVQCHPGYSLYPSEGSLLKCNEGFISLPLPQCVQTRNCTYNCDLQFGHCEPEDQQVFLAGDIVSSVCEAGYSLNTDISRRTCGEDGNWDHEHQPSCVLSGGWCKITPSEAVEYFLDPQLAIEKVPHGTQIEVQCKKGYYTRSKGPLKITCKDGIFDRQLKDLCHFIGVNVKINYNFTERGENHSNSSNGDFSRTFKKGETVVLTCKTSSDTEDGLPYPEVTWLYPARLRGFVDYHNGDTFVHTDYRDSVSQKYSISVDVVDKGLQHYAQGILTIKPTMEVHSGEYTCVVKLVNDTNISKATIKIAPDMVIEMYFLLIVPVVLFVIVHCFYRKATLSPFPAPNKLTKDMMQEVDKKKKLEELKANPAYQHIQVMGDQKNHRGRRGAVVDI